MVCTDPSTGEWEFRVNGKTFGRTTTESCGLNVANTSLAFEVVSDTGTVDNAASLPNLGPLVLGNMQFWDDAQWHTIPKAVLSYSAGDTDNGTQVEQAAVCPPYGAQPLDSVHFSVGSNLECAPVGSLIWTDTPQ